jgi:hypothetical protein
VDLGQGAGDVLVINRAHQTDNVVVFTDTSFTMNDAVGTSAGIEIVAFIGSGAAGGGDDTVDGSALTANVQLQTATGTGADWVAPGANLGDIAIGGGDAGDTLSYGTRTTCTHIEGGSAGQDTDCDGVFDAGEEATPTLASTPTRPGAGMTRSSARPPTRRSSRVTATTTSQVEAPRVLAHSTRSTTPARLPPS